MVGIYCMVVCVWGGVGCLFLNWLCFAVCWCLRFWVDLGVWVGVCVCSLMGCGFDIRGLLWLFCCSWVVGGRIFGVWAEVSGFGCWGTG